MWWSRTTTLAFGCADLEGGGVDVSVAPVSEVGPGDVVQGPVDVDTSSPEGLEEADGLRPGGELLLGPLSRLERHGLR